MQRVAIVSFLLLGIVSASRAENIVVHEWGTFTSLQSESGRALKGIARDVEPLPPFVKSLQPDLGGPKGIPDSISPEVTMRLETPVVYFHLPAGSPPIKVDFSATFHGGLLSQWYPFAENSMSPLSIPKLSEKTNNTLSWTGVTVGVPSTLPQTDSHVWLAPRNVDAADVTSNGQSERYLFYRGVGKLDAPLKIVRDGPTLRAGWQVDPTLTNAPDMHINELWYVDIRADGTSAYRTLSHGRADTPAAFEPTDYSSDRLEKLKDEMRVKLVDAGLFEDEARAMLSTWDQAYFKSAGTRVFFIVPRSWTDYYLPIKLSVPARIERVMVGRIDLVTPKQRELARKYMQIPQGNTTQGPPLLSEMGRFAWAIIADEQRENLQLQGSSGR